MGAREKTGLPEAASRQWSAENEKLGELLRRLEAKII